MQKIPWMERKTNGAVLQETDENHQFKQEITRKQSTFWGMLWTERKTNEAEIGRAHV